MSDDFGSFTMAQAKRDFAIGQMESFAIMRAAMGEGWNITFKAGTIRGPLVDARDGDVREFKTLDACVTALQIIGFKVDYLS